MRKGLGLACATIIAAGGIVGATPAYAGQEIDHVTCGSDELTLRVNDSNSSDHGGWSVAQVVGDGHLIPVTFSGVAFDETINGVIFEFSGPKGRGHANHQQPTEQCSSVDHGTLADLLDPGETPPPGTSLTDEVTFTFTATVVRK